MTHVRVYTMYFVTLICIRVVNGYPLLTDVCVVHATLTLTLTLTVCSVHVGAEYAGGDGRSRSITHWLSVRELHAGDVYWWHSLRSAFTSHSRRRRDALCTRVSDLRSSDDRSDLSVLVLVGVCVVSRTRSDGGYVQLVWGDTAE